MTYFVQSGNTLHVHSGDSLNIKETLPVGNYTVMFDETRGCYYLTTIDDFPQSGKLYGKTEKQAKRILESFHGRPQSTGVLLSGEKGSGKTLLARTISYMAKAQGLPTIIINQGFHGDIFNKFMQDISQKCVILFDEFEKVYDKDAQEAALTLFDGVYQSKNLFLLTCNDKWRVNEHMRNRPGRIYYLIDFTGLEEAFVREYCEDNLNNKTYIDNICTMSSVFDNFNFDMLKAMVEEMNRYNESPSEVLQMLNIKADASSLYAHYTVTMTNEKGVTVQSFRLDGNPIGYHGTPSKDVIDVQYDVNKKEVSFQISPDNITKYLGAAGVVEYTHPNGHRLFFTEKNIKFNPLAV